MAMVVSNNRYRLGRALGSGTRPQLDSGVLRVTVLQPIGANVDGAVTRRLAVQQWTAPTFEIYAGTHRLLQGSMARRRSWIRRCDSGSCQGHCAFESHVTTLASRHPRSAPIRRGR
ncbi:MAG: hypothetical protein WBP81_28290 [Solirubrobacteraceae bacterium]